MMDELVRIVNCCEDKTGDKMEIVGGLGVIMN